MCSRAATTKRLERSGDWRMKSRDSRPQRSALSRALDRTFRSSQRRADSEEKATPRRPAEFENLEPRLLLSADLPVATALAVAVQETPAASHSTPNIDVGAQPPVVSIGAPERKDVSTPFAGQSIYLDVGSTPPAGTGAEHDKGIPAAGAPSQASDQSNHSQPLGASALLTPDMDYATAANAPLDASLKVVDVDGKQFLRLIDNPSGATLREELLDADKSILVSGGDRNDKLTLDFDSSAALHHIEVIFDGGAGEDTLRGATNDTGWTIYGANSGFADAVQFRNVENLRGAANNDDTFTLLAGGSLSGVMDGGDGGFDSLILGAGTFGSVVYTVSGPQSGTISRDGDVLTYAGLEPIIDNLVTANRVISASDFTDNARLSDLGAQLKFESTDAIPTFESITFAKPTNSLTINLGADNGIPVISDTDKLEIQAVNLNADLIVNGQAGKDEVTITGSMNLSGNPLNINAEQIKVNPGVQIDAGNINLNAIATQGSLGTPDTLPIANVAAGVTVNGATLNGNDITLTANAGLVSNVTNPLPNIPAASLLANVTAEVAVTGNAAINASGLFAAHAESNVTATVVATPATGAVGELAIAAPVINTTARSHLSDNAEIGRAHV